MFFWNLIFSYFLPNLSSKLYQNWASFGHARPGSSVINNIKISLFGTLDGAPFLAPLQDLQKFGPYRFFVIFGVPFGTHFYIFFWVLFFNLPKVEWKYIFESNKTRVARHHQKAKDIGLPGIPYWRNTGTGAVIYVNEEGKAYGMCGPAPLIIKNKIPFSTLR